MERHITSDVPATVLISSSVFSATVWLGNTFSLTISSAVEAISSKYAFDESSIFINPFLDACR